MATRRLLKAYPCPECRGAAPTRSVEDDDGYLVRRRRCEVCHHEFDTYEVPAEALAKLLRRARERNAA